MSKSVPDFEPVFHRLNQAMDSINCRWALIGGMAVILRGHSRTTADIDATVWDEKDDMERTLNALTKAGFKSRIPDPLPFAKANRIFLLESEEGVQVDLSLGALPFEEGFIASAEQFSVGQDLRIPVANVADLIVMKLVAGRPRDLEDCRRLTELHPDLDWHFIEATVQEFSDLLEIPEMMKNLQDLRHMK